MSLNLSFCEISIRIAKQHSLNFCKKHRRKNVDKFSTILGSSDEKIFAVVQPVIQPVIRLY